MAATSATNVRGFALSRYGAELTEIDLPDPVPGPEDVVIDVAAAGVNQLDAKIRSGALKSVLPQRFPLVLGHDVAGTVRATGADVREFRVGDRVYGRVRDGRIGTFATRITAPAADLAPLPAGLSFPAAATLPLPALTAWQAFTQVAPVQPGQQVLVHAGAGAVGVVAIQLAKHLGARVATTASARNHELLRQLGADELIDYRHADFAAGPPRFDLVLDAVGGDTLKRSWAALRPGGTVIGLVQPPDLAFARRAQLALPLRAGIALLAAPTQWRARRHRAHYRFLFMEASGRQLRQLAPLVEGGQLRPVIRETYPFAATPQALAALDASGAPGKIVIDFAA